MEPVPRFVELPTGVTLPYVEQGGPLGMPLILLHGYADSWRSFASLLHYLPASTHVFAPSQRGHGDASRPATGYGTRHFTADLAAFMDALGLGAAVLVGGSSGGFVVRRFAIDHPQRVLGLVLLGSPASLGDKPEMRETWDTTFAKLTDPIDPGFVREFQQSTLVQLVSPAFLETMAQESLKVPAHVWRATFEGLLEDDSFAELGQIQAPTLLVWGDRDAIVPQSDQEALAAAIPGARLAVVPGAGHALYWEVPHRVASDIAAFVKDLAGWGQPGRRGAG